VFPVPAKRSVNRWNKVVLDRLSRSEQSRKSLKRILRQLLLLRNHLKSFFSLLVACITIEDRVCHSFYLQLKKNPFPSFYGEQDLNQSFSKTFNVLFRPAIMRQPVISVLILSMRTKAGIPFFLGKWWPLHQTLQALTQWPESQSTLGTRFVSSSPHYFTSYTLKIPGFVSFTGRGRLVSVVVESERQTKEQRGQWKRLAKTKTKDAYRMGKKSTMHFVQWS